MDKGNIENKGDVDENKFLLSLLKGVKEVFVLWIISKNKIHGYGIVSKLNKSLKNLEGKKVVHTSSIYPILYSLEEEGLISSSEQLNGKHKVKIYEITPEGISKLNSIKTCINSTKDENHLIPFFDDMIFNDKIFTYDDEGGE